MVKLPDIPVEYGDGRRTFIRQVDNVARIELQRLDGNACVTVDSEELSMTDLLQACNEASERIIEVKRLKRLVKHRKRPDLQQRCIELSNRLTELEEEIKRLTRDLESRIQRAVERMVR